MTQTEALRLALQVITRIPTLSHGVLVRLSDVETAIKAALANEALERKAENARELGLNYYVPCCADQTCPKCKAAPEAKDEPVIDESAAKRIATALGWEPKRKSLTDEEIQKCYETTGHYQTLRPQDRSAVFALARAIEAAHGIKEKT